MSSSISLTLRAVLAVGLLIAFYLLALAIAGVLLFVPYAMVVYGHRISFRLTIFCLIGAGVILWSMLNNLRELEKNLWKDVGLGVYLPKVMSILASDH